MSKAHSVGTKLLLGSSTAAKVIGGIKSISGVEVTGDSVDVTALDNTSGYREYVRGFKDGGEISVSGYMDGADAGQEAMYAAMESGAVTAFEIRFPAAIGKSWTGSCVVTKFATGVDVDGAITFDGTLKVSGKPALDDTATGSGGSGVG